MDYGRVTVQHETVRRCLAVEYVLHIELGEVHLMLSPLYEFVKFRTELLYLFFISVQHYQIASCNHLQSRKIGTEFRQYLISGPVYFYRVHCFQCNVFSHVFVNADLPGLFRIFQSAKLHL